MMEERNRSQPLPGLPPASNEQGHVRSQYRSQDNLAIRIRTHELYSEVNDDFAAWVLDAIPWRGDELVVDVGCGAGSYIDAMRQRSPYYVAGDLSMGMLRGLPQRDISRINLDAGHLPVGAATADVILANHMLYHVPDIDRAVAEFRRVLKPTGRLLAATNSDETMAELEALQGEVMARLGMAGGSVFRMELTFTLENGEAYLRRAFARVERRLLHNALVFRQPQPVIEYVGSSFERFEPYLPDGAGWQDVAALLHELLSHHIRRHGEFRVSKLSGVFIAWND